MDVAIYSAAKLFVIYSHDHFIMLNQVVTSPTQQNDPINLDTPPPVIFDRYGFINTDSRFEQKKMDDSQTIWLENSRTKKWIIMVGPTMEHWDR